MVAVLAAGALAGCAHKLTLEEAQALCTQQGGFLVIIHAQPISKAGVIGPDEPSPGECVAPGKFDVAKPVPAQPPAQAN